MFNIPIFPKIRCIIDNEECFIINQNVEHTNIKNLDYNELISNQMFINEIRKLFIFRYLVCLTCNNESKIDVIIKKNKSLYIQQTIYIPVTFKDTGYKTEFDSQTNNIPKTIIEKWFDNEERVLYEMMNEMVSTLNSNYSSEIRDIFQKYIVEERKKINREDVHFLHKVKELDGLVWWSNAIVDRIRNVKN